MADVKALMIKALTTFAMVLLLTPLAQATTPGWQPQEGSELIGKPAPEFSGLKWLNSPALTIQGLRGKPVFIRFWLTDCPMCQKTGPTLNYLNKTYAGQGLVVIGIHHPKSAAVEDPAVVQRALDALGFRFPVAIDNGWRTIDAYWTGKNRSYTSASFLIDRSGKIVWVHDGGTLLLPARYGGSNAEEPAFESLERVLKTVMPNLPAKNSTEASEADPK